jgi:hypothetical protein
LPTRSVFRKLPVWRNGLHDRFSKWIDASIAASAVEAFMAPVVQGLGRFDCQLIQEDVRFTSLPQNQQTSPDESDLLMNRFTLSYFWVLAAYELVRTLDEYCRTGATSVPVQFHSRIATLKRRMERLRIPLAKMQTARRFSTDSPIAYPALSRDFGVAWQVAQETYITRRELSDALLELLTDLRASLHESATSN